MICDTVRIMDNNTGEILIKKDCKNNSIKSEFGYIMIFMEKLKKLNFGNFQVFGCKQCPATARTFSSSLQRKSFRGFIQF